MRARRPRPQARSITALLLALSGTRWDLIAALVVPFTVFGVIPQVALNWLIGQQAVLPIPGAKNGRQALECLDSIEPPRLILLDIMMPFADGFEVLAEIRARKDRF